MTLPNGRPVKIKSPFKIIKKETEKELEIKTIPYELKKKILSMAKNGSDYFSITPLLVPPDSLSYKVLEIMKSEDTSPIFVVDKVDQIDRFRGNPKAFTLEPLPKSELDSYWSSMPASITKRMGNVLRDHAPYPIIQKIESDTLSLTEGLTQYNVVRKIAPIIGIDDILEITDYWDDFIENLISFKKVKIDDRLYQIRRTHVLCGVQQAFNNHTILITNPGVGKSTFYQVMGVVVEKGFKESIFGTIQHDGKRTLGIHKQREVYVIENVEAHSIDADVLGRALNFMESGHAQLKPYGITLTSEGTCPIVLTGNPSTDIGAMLMKISINVEGAGRRFGTLAINKDYKSMDDSAFKNNIPDKKELEEWKAHKVVFRSIEDYVQDSIFWIFEQKEVRDFINTPSISYQTEVERTYLPKIPIIQLADFVRSQCRQSYTHRNGGAVSSAILDFIPDLVHYKYEGKPIPTSLVTDIIETAKPIVEELELICLDSLKATITPSLFTPDAIKSFKESILETIKPQPLKDLIHAVEGYRNSGGKPGLLLIEQLEPYKPPHITYWSREVKGRIANYVDVSQYNDKLRRYFNFTVLVNQMEGVYVEIM
jgi:hypothetical protein